MASASKLSNSGRGSDVSVQDLSDQIAILKDDIASLTDTLGTLSKVKAQDAATTARETAQDLTEKGREKALETQLQAEDFIRKQPGTALGLAAGIGFFVGMLSARR